MSTTALTICALIIVGTLWLQATTYYILEADRLLIRRAGFIWMKILFRDVVEIEYRIFFFNRFLQIAMCRLSFRRKMMRIRKERGFRYVLINPRDPAPIIEAFEKFRASLMAEVPEQNGNAQNAGPLPDFLRHTP